ncbi:MAG: 3-hydroxyacyl-CoA dehydrogenase [Panacagrimonas sp.]
MTKKLHVGVVGAGTMGRGIVQLFAQAGHPVSVFDAYDGAVPKALTAVAGMISKGVEKGRYTSDQADALIAGIRPCGSLEALASCDVVIEAIVEEIGAKQSLFAALEAVVPEHTILASNTSSLVVAEIAAKCRHPSRVAGLHFFNPVPLMKVVEIIAAVRTAPGTVETLRRLIAGSGHRAVIAADQPGFLVNHAGRGYYTEALRVIEEQVASVAEVDALMREAAGFKMGPFELLDLTGLDVSGKVMESIYEQFQQEPRFRPSSLVRPRIAAGLYGRKSGAGWYRYDAQSRPLDLPAPRAVPALPKGLKLWIEPSSLQREAISKLAVSLSVQLVASAADADLILVQPWGQDATTVCVEQGLDATRSVAFDPLSGWAKRRTLMLTPVTSTAARDAAHALFASSDTPVTIINDSPGFVVQRVLATIVNIAANIAQRGIASVADIEDAVKLGLGYPHGPLAWGDRIGGDRVLSILRNMQAVTGDPRYRPSPWLARRVGLGLSLLTPEAARGTTPRSEQLLRGLSPAGAIG